MTELKLNDVITVTIHSVFSLFFLLIGAVGNDDDVDENLANIT